MSKNSGDIFNGFSREMSDFLVERRFNNNREWFDNNRERYFSLLKEPMDSFAREVNAELCRRTGIKTIPSVSRINRDIRFSKNKEPYRDHRWVVFKRDTGEWKHKPVHYFEIGADYFTIGMGTYDAKPAYMQALRKKIDSNTAEFERLVKRYDESIFKLCGEKYKKRFPGERSEVIDNWYMRKNIYLQYTSPVNEAVLTREIFDFCLEQFLFLMPVINYMSNVSF